MEKATKREIGFFVILILVAGYFLFKLPAKPVVYKASETVIYKGEVRMLFVGDIMLDRNVRKFIDTNGFEPVVEGIKPLFVNSDITIGNLEGTITSNPSVSVVDNSILHFTFDPKTAKMLKDAGFNGFSLANNHALDFYQAGYDETIKNLKENGLFYFGAPLNNQNLSYQESINGEKLCFVGYHALYTHDPAPVLKEIRLEESTCDFVIVFMHSGVEYQPKESSEQKQDAHAFVDAGADLVIGAHPHVIEPIEIYKNRAIFYSLGNFIFDQGFSIATKQGLAVRVDLKPDRVKYHLTGIGISMGKLSFPEKESFEPQTQVLISELPKSLKEPVDIDGEFVLTR